MAGKGSRPRPADREKFAANHDRIFGKRKSAPEGLAGGPTFYMDGKGAYPAEHERVFGKRKPGPAGREKRVLVKGKLVSEWEATTGLPGYLEPHWEDIWRGPTFKEFEAWHNASVARKLPKKDRAVQRPARAAGDQS